MTSSRFLASKLLILVLAAIVEVGCRSGGSLDDGSGDGGGGGSDGSMDGGVRRVTLVGNYLGQTTQGWNMATETVTSGTAGSDFYLSMTMVVSLFPTTLMSAFCQKDPAAGAPPYATVADIPSDTAGCNWGTAYLGGTTDHTESLYAGQAFLVYDRASGSAKLLTIADSIVNGDVTVTFDILRL
jgi:hypothetical protein